MNTPKPGKEVGGCAGGGDAAIRGRPAHRNQAAASERRSAKKQSQNDPHPSQGKLHGRSQPLQRTEKSRHDEKTDKKEHCRKKRVLRRAHVDKE